MKFLLLYTVISITLQSGAQRVYAPNSVLSTGSWYQLAITNTGIYKLDVAMLNAMGINTNNLSSNSIRLYGNTGTMLPEDNATIPLDDLQENAIEVVDGGDGIFNGTDYILYYAQGTQAWLKDSANNAFIPNTNYYSTKAYYYLTIANTGTGKRIGTAPTSTSFTTTVTSYNERLAIQERTTNLISSGKQWVGQEYSNLPGRITTKNYNIAIPNNIPTVPVRLFATTWARSSSPTSFAISSGGSNIIQLPMPAVSASVLDVYATISTAAAQYNAAASIAPITVTYNTGSSTAQGWLHSLVLQARAALNMQGIPQLSFRDWLSVQAGSTAKYVIDNASNVQVWDVTDPINPTKQVVLPQGTSSYFVQSAARLREYIAYTPNTYLTHTYTGQVPNQNLHNSSPKHLLIITHPTLLTQANTIASYHSTQQGMQVQVATTNQVYQEYGSGIADVSALRNYIKMYYDKYNATSTPLQNVLLLGDASYDYLDRINNNTNLVPSWQSINSTDPLQSYVTDDYLGYLKDNDNINAPGAVLLSVGIGRVPARNAIDALAYTNKVLSYTQPPALGAWRNQVQLIADDEDGNLHFNDAEAHSITLKQSNPTLNQNKIYLDAYRQESNSGGSRYPAVNADINNAIANGSLILNYSGHGGYRRLADEGILDADMVASWSNKHKLPLLITATCDFAPYDDPQQYSIGENILLQAQAGAIALMTTTRIVFAFSNKIINNNYLLLATKRNADGTYMNLGQANMRTKNYTVLNGGDVVNCRKFTLLGNPAVTIGYAKHNVLTTTFNSNTYNPTTDTIKALSKVTLGGVVTNTSGSILNTFNGVINVTVYDKPQQITTLANDAGSVSTAFTNTGNILFKGDASVTNGTYTSTFIAPKDMQVAYGTGTISYYAYTDSADANGTTPITIGGTSNAISIDNEPPVIKAFLNDYTFINGGITNATPTLLLKLSDSSGINISNAAIGHDVTLVIDGDINNTIVLNTYYNAALNNYKQGTVQYALPKLSAGLHTFTIKAWDVYNNASLTSLTAIVGDANELVVSKVLNYPNPFSTNTVFWLEHNKPNENLQVTISIYTITGKLVKQIQETINTQGNRSSSVHWNGKDEYDAKLAYGTYLYLLKVKDTKGNVVVKKEKLFKF